MNIIFTIYLCHLKCKFFPLLTKDDFRWVLKHTLYSCLSSPALSSWWLKVLLIYTIYMLPNPSLKRHKGPSVPATSFFFNGSTSPKSWRNKLGNCRWYYLTKIPYKIEMSQNVKPWMKTRKLCVCNSAIRVDSLSHKILPFIEWTYHFQLLILLN